MSCNELGNKPAKSDDLRKIIQFEENKMVYIANNVEGKRVLMYDVDGYLFQSEIKKCDKAFLLPDIKHAYLIELKGSDLKKAAEQIYASLEVLKSCLSDCCTIHGRIVCSRVPVPDLRSTQVVKLERALAKRNGRLEKQSKRMIENI
jgi:hypothetical protein